MTFRQQLLSSSNCCLLFSARGRHREQQIVVDVAQLLGPLVSVHDTLPLLSDLDCLATICLFKNNVSTARWDWCSWLFSNIVAYLCAVMSGIKCHKDCLSVWLVCIVFVEDILGRTRAEFENGDGQAQRKDIWSAVTELSIAPRARTSK